MPTEKRKLCRTSGLVLVTSLWLLVAGTLSAYGWDPHWELAGQRRLTPSDPAYFALREAWRLDRNVSWSGSRFPLRRESAAAALAQARPPSPAAQAAARWLFARRTRPDQALRVSVDLTGLAFAADPHLQLQPAFRDIREGDSVDPAGRARLGLWADATLSAGLSAHFRYVFDSDGRNDPHRRTREFSTLGTNNNVDEAYLSYARGAFAFTLGRTFLDWGPERQGGLILSPLAPAVDMLLGELNLGPHRLSAFAGQLSTEEAEIAVEFELPPDGEASIDVPLARYLYGHRLDLVFGHWLQVGISEVALTSSQTGGLDLKYLNPVNFYAQAGSEQDGRSGEGVNVLASTDASLWWKGLHLYGSFLVDDVQLDSDQRAQWPDQLAWTAGFDFRPFGPGWWLGYEYRYVGSWTYLHRSPGLDYHNFQRPLGAPEGPDGDRHSLLMQWRPDHRWRLWVAGEYRRRGINRMWTDASREGHAGEDFPRGTDEQRSVGRAGVTWQMAPYGEVWARVSYAHVAHVNNGDTNTDVWELRAGLRLFSPAAVVP